MRNLPPRARLGIVAVVVVLVLGGAVYAIFLRGGDDAPVSEAGSRFSDKSGGASGAPLSATELASAESSKTGSDPAPPSEDEIKDSPGAAVAGLFLVGFRGTLRDTPFLKRLAAIPYGGLLLTENNYEQPQQLSGPDLQAAGGGARGRPPGAAHRGQAGGRGVQRLRQPRPRGAGRRRGGHARRDRGSRRRRRPQQLDALGVGVNLAPNADIAVAGGPGQGRAFSDTPAQVSERRAGDRRRVQRGSASPRPSARSRATARPRRTRTPAPRRSASRSRTCATPT